MRTSEARMGVAAFAAFVACGCGGTIKFEGDGEEDAGVPDAAPDGAVDVLPDPIEDGVADTHADTHADTGHDPGPDVVTDGTTDTGPACISVGCSTMPDGGLPCCGELDLVAECEPWDPTCTSSLHFCVACGNGSCDPHETKHNCIEDCHSGCEPGTGMGYSCTPEELWDCVCEEDPCAPECTGGGPGTMPRWTDPCSGETYDGMCMPGDVAECLYIGTDSEGWYTRDPMGGEHLLDWADCAPEWLCFGAD